MTAPDTATGLKTPAMDLLGGMPAERPEPFPVHAPSEAELFLTTSSMLAFDSKEARVGKPFVPLGVLYLSAFLKREGFLVDVCDATFLDWAGWIARLAATAAPVVGVSATITCRTVASRMTEAAHAAGKRVIAGGPDPSASPEHYLAKGADVVVMGEGELTLTELAQISRSGEWTDERLAAVKGIAFLDAAGHLRRTPPRPNIPDLDSLPWPDREAIPFHQYLDAWRSRHGYAMVSLVTVRGCPFPCRWCSKSVYGDSFRHRSPESVVAEMRYLLETWRPERLWFADDVLTLNERRFMKLSEAIIDAGLKHPFDCLSRADCLSEKSIERLAAMGARLMWMGAESGSQKVLDAMDKRIKVEDVVTWSGAAKRAGIQIGFFLILGYPGETVDDILATERLLERTQPDVYAITIAFPIPGTKFHADVNEQIVPGRLWQERNANIPSIRDQMPWPAYSLAVRALHNAYRLARLRAEGRGNSLEAWFRRAKRLVCHLGMRAFALVQRIRRGQPRVLDKRDPRKIPVTEPM